MSFKERPAFGYVYCVKMTIDSQANLYASKGSINLDNRVK